MWIISILQFKIGDLFFFCQRRTILFPQCDRASSVDVASRVCHVEGRDFHFESYAWLQRFSLPQFTVVNQAARSILSLRCSRMRSRARFVIVAPSKSSSLSLSRVVIITFLCVFVCVCVYFFWVKLSGWPVSSRCRQASLTSINMVLPAATEPLPINLPVPRTTVFLEVLGSVMRSLFFLLCSALLLKGAFHVIMCFHRPATLMLWRGLRPTISDVISSFLYFILIWYFITTQASWEDGPTKKEEMN